MRIYADPNNCTADHKLRLIVEGALRDIAKLEGQMQPGAPVTFYGEDFEMQGVLERDENDEMWLGVADWASWKDL